MSAPRKENHQSKLLQMSFKGAWVHSIFIAELVGILFVVLNLQALGIQEWSVYGIFLCGYREPPRPACEFCDWKLLKVIALNWDNNRCLGL